jgi:hypothetical protein
MLNCRCSLRELALDRGAIRDSVALFHGLASMATTFHRIAIGNRSLLKLISPGLS